MHKNKIDVHYLWFPSLHQGQWFDLVTEAFDAGTELQVGTRWSVGRVQQPPESGGRETELGHLEMVMWVEEIGYLC